MAEVRTKPRGDYTCFKSPGFAILSDSEILIFGGYFSDSTSSDLCFSWRVAGGEKPRVSISKLSCRLPVAEGFENCCALVDEEGVFALQNIEDEEDTYLESERKLLRFNLRDRHWQQLQVIEE
jgi:hypothetical protein